jgi:hypothetical protein
MVVSAFVVRLSTATPVSSVEIARSWLGGATAAVLISFGPSAAPPAPPPFSPPLSPFSPPRASDGRGAGVIADTVPSLGTAIHSRPLPSKMPPVMPGGYRSASPIGVSVRGSSWRTTPWTASMTNAASSCSATLTPMPDVVGVVAKTCNDVRSIELIKPVLTSRRITNRSLWLTCIWWPRALGMSTRVSTLAVTPLIRAISPFVRLHTQDAAS